MEDNIFEAALDLDQFGGLDNTPARTNDDMPLDIPQMSAKSIIKVVGVGGGGGNAVNHMYNEGIHDVTFAVCNTDAKALEDSRVPYKLQLGKDGLGAGNKPEKAKSATLESLEQVKAMFNDGTRMAFITAGMGGGTGTGAAPLIAKVAKDMDILTIGIVTIPFKWEGKMKIDQALDGVDELSKNVDAMLVINNERLLELFQGKNMCDAFAISDDTLCNAAKSISEIITMHGKINLDFQDVTTILKNGGVAIMSTGEAEGDNRVSAAIEAALHSPLLNNNDVYKSKKVLLHIVEPGPEGDKPLMVDEVQEITEFMTKMENENLETKWGMSFNPSLKGKVKITILASGFGLNDIHSDEMDERIKKQEAVDWQREEAKKIRREEIYGADDKTGYVHKPVNYYLFKEDDLDNDDLISSVVSVPTYKRPKSMLEQLETLSKGVKTVAE